MPQNKYRILSTREVATDLIETAADAGIDIEVKQFIDIRPVVTDAGLKKRVKALYDMAAQVVFTSANAVDAVEALVFDRPRRFYEDYEACPPPEADEIPGTPGFHSYIIGGWSVHCLAGGTQDAVKRLLPEANIVSTAKNATALAEKIVQAGNISSVVFFCGNKRRDELPGILHAHHIAVEEVVVYETLEAPAITEKDYDGIFFLSPSAVKSFFSVNSLPKHTICFAIGATTARELEDFTDNKVIVSTTPHMRDMVQTSIFYFNNLNCYE
jgi:uroporphyrinogen-III synthase